MKSKLPKKVTMLELFSRDGLQNLDTYVPMETKLWFIKQFIKAGYKIVEVTNFAPPHLLPQTKDAEELMKKVWKIEEVQQGKVHLKCYGMTIKSFERAAEMKQKGYGPHSVAFTISTEDLHGVRNSGRTREQFLKEIPEMVRIAKENDFTIDMALACVYGSPCAGPVPIQNTIDLMEKGLDMGIRNFTPCDTTGESNPLRTYEYMSTLVDKFGKYPDIHFKVAHFHDTRGMGLANYLACIMAGAEVVEGSLGALGGQPNWIVDGVAGIGSGPNYCNTDAVGNGSSEDLLVMLDEMGIDTGIDIDYMLQLGRVLEWTLKKELRPNCTKAGRVLKEPVTWNTPRMSLKHVPPYKAVTWGYPEKYK